MFSWSSAATRRPTDYPAARVAGSSPAVAQTINGSIRPPEITRAQHLESYLQDDNLRRSTRRVSHDDSTYDTVFQTTKGDTLIVRVHLPPTSLPNGAVARAPAMTLAGVRAKHPWLDSRMRITGYSKTQSDEAWKSSRMLLGAAVHEVVKHLQLNPPELLEITDSGLRAIQSNSRSNSRHSSAASSPVRSGSGHNVRNSILDDDAPPDYSTVLSMPDIPRQFPELDSLTREDLEDLLEDELNFASFVNKLSVFQKIQSTSDDILAENVKLAKSHLEEEEKLKSLHKEVTELKSTMETKLQNFQELERKQDAICAPPDKRDVMRQLLRAKKEAFDESEQFAEEWVEEGDSVAGFAKKFIEMRKVHHFRAAKLELLQHNKSL